MTKYNFPIVSGQLKMGESGSGKVVYEVKNEAYKKISDLILVDSAAGIGCPVIASLSGVDITLIVTEPTLSGIHDLERVAGVAHHFGIKTLVCINKYDLNLKITQNIENFCKTYNIELVGKIPFNKAVTEALVIGKPVVEYIRFFFQKGPCFFSKDHGRLHTPVYLHRNAIVKIDRYCRTRGLFRLVYEMRRNKKNNKKRIGRKAQKKIALPHRKYGG